MKIPAYQYSDVVELTGSRTNVPEEREIGRPHPDKKIQLTAILFWDNIPAEFSEGHPFLSREDFEKRHNVSREKFQKFQDFAGSNNLQIQLSSDIRRYITLRGRVQDFEHAFSIKLRTYITASGRKFISYCGGIMLPVALEGIVEAIIGFDDREKAISSIVGMPRGGIAQYYTPQQVAEVYDFPAACTGKKQCIALLQFGGGYNDADMQHYFQHNKLKMPHLYWVGVNGARNSPAVYNSGFDQEVAMNIQVAGSIANDAKIVVYFAPNTDDGFLAAFAAAVHDKVHQPTVISVSWGAPEKKWSPMAMDLINEVCRNAATLGITICVAAGNKGMQNGVDDGNYHVDFPASSPYVLSCGGTKLKIFRKIISEMPWGDGPGNAGGGGISTHFPLPWYQVDSHISVAGYTHNFNGRALPDVAGNASPLTGYRIYAHSQWGVVAGTSSVAPLYAGLVARLNEQQNANIGFVNPLLYKQPSLCRQLSVNRYLNKKNKQNTPCWNVTTGLGIFYRITQE